MVATKNSKGFLPAQTRQSFALVISPFGAKELYLSNFYFWWIDNDKT